MKIEFRGVSRRTLVREVTGVTTDAWDAKDGLRLNVSVRILSISARLSSSSCSEESIAFGRLLTDEFVYCKLAIDGCVDLRL